MSSVVVQAVGRHGSPAVQATALSLTCGELLAGDPIDLVHIAEDRPQLGEIRAATIGQVGGRLQQVLVGGDLPRSSKQQRRYCLVAADPVLRDVLTPDPQSQLR